MGANFKGICENCKKPFFVKTYFLLPKYCSRKCAGESRKGRMGVSPATEMIRCVHCGKEKEIGAFQAKTRKFCSQNCSHEHQREHNATRRPVYGKPMRDRIRKEKCYKCEICDWKEEPGILEIHHKDGNPTNRSEDNLQLVCPNCHKMHHFRTKTGMFSTRPRWKTEPEKRMTKIRVLATRNMPPQMTIPM